jgi:hypothetical protein
VPRLSRRADMEGAPGEVDRPGPPSVPSIQPSGGRFEGGRFYIYRSFEKFFRSATAQMPAAVKKSFDAMVEAEAAFKADLENLLKNEGHMPEDKYLVMSRKGKRLGVAYASTPRGEGGAASLKFKTK